MKKNNGYRPYVYKRADDLGIPIKDATSRIKIVVTDNDVVSAKKADSKHCALARAALRLPGVKAAYFFRQIAFLEYANKMLKFHLPESVTREIVTFDRAQIFDSGIYQMRPPAAVADAPGNRQARQAGQGSTPRCPQGAGIGGQAEGVDGTQQAPWRPHGVRHRACRRTGAAARQGTYPVRAQDAVRQGFARAGVSQWRTR